MANNIKDYREKELRSFHALNIIIFYLCHSEILAEASITIEILLTDIIQNIIIAVIIPLTITVIENTLTKKQKNKLFIFRLAGETIFTRIKENKVTDIRFDAKEALKVYAPIIEKLNDCRSTEERRVLENKEWYRIYKNHEKTGAVENTQRAYLLCRDIYITTFLTEFFLYPIIFIFIQILTHQIFISYLYIFYLLFCTILSSIMTYNTMNEFVNTVIAKDMANQKLNHKEQNHVL